MITRIAIDGFKSFVGFELDVPQLLVLVGANNGGKSNLLEAVEIYRDLQVAGRDLAFALRSRSSAVFHRDVRGREVDELCIDVTADGTNGPVVLRRGPNGRLSGGGRTRNRSLDGGLLRIDPVPEEMRGGADRGLSERLLRSGGNVAAVAAALANDAGHPAAFGDLRMDLAAVLPGFADLVPVYDERREVWDLDLVFDTGRRSPCSMVSDGTLRVLGVLVAVHSMAVTGGTLLIDEIEVGLHPAFLVTLLDRIGRRLADHPGLQVVTTTHSPVVVGQVVATRADSVVFLDQVYGAMLWPDGEKTPNERTRARRVAASGEPGHFVSPREVRRYLETVQPMAALA